MNFEQFEVVTKKNEKKGGVTRKGQNFDVKYRRFTLNGKEEEKVVFSDLVWGELGLETNGLIQLYNSSTKELLVAVVPTEHAVIFKTQPNTTTKGKHFKATKFTASLIDAGLIDDEAKYADGGSNQFLALEAYELDGAPEYFIATYKVVKGEKKKTGVSSEPVEETPTPSEAPEDSNNVGGFEEATADTADVSANDAVDGADEGGIEGEVTFE